MTETERFMAENLFFECTRRFNCKITHANCVRSRAAATKVLRNEASLRKMSRSDIENFKKCATCPMAEKNERIAKKNQVGKILVPGLFPDGLIKFCFCGEKIIRGNFQTERSWGMTKYCPNHQGLPTYKLKAEKALYKLLSAA